MKYIGTVEGIRNDFKEKRFFEKTKFQINYTSDGIGKTFSISDIEKGIQYSIPFDELIKIINKGEHK